ncbi:MAG: alpha-ketoacid dehydrogenase subunit beta [SAR202 cluster bacterium]|nr:alpha-ketoacid dehydrogenase subunit beta [SAR202 cluster bacterium]
MRELEYAKAIREALYQEMEIDDQIICFGEDVALYGGLWGSTKGLQKKFGSARVFDTPISEAGIVGMGVGAALMGMKPVVELQFTGLITVAMDPIVNTAAKARYINNGSMNVPIVIRSITMSANNVYMGQSLEAWFAHVPGLKVVVPSNSHDVKGLMTTAINDPDPVVFFEHEGLYKSVGEVPEERYEIPFGKAAILKEGSDVTIVAWSKMLEEVEIAATRLESENISVEIIDPRTLVPLDFDAIVKSVEKTGRLVIAHEAVKVGGFGGEIAARFSESEASKFLKSSIVRVGNKGAPVPYSSDLSKYVVPSAKDVELAVKTTMGVTKGDL